MTQLSLNDVPDGHIPDILRWVNDDPARAQAALDAELLGRQRSTLTSALQTIADRPTGGNNPMPNTTDRGKTVEDFEVRVANGAIAVRFNGQNYALTANQSVAFAKQVTRALIGVVR